MYEISRGRGRGGSRGRGRRLGGRWGRGWGYGRAGGGDAVQGERRSRQLCIGSGRCAQSEKRHGEYRRRRHQCRQDVMHSRRQVCA